MLDLNGRIPVELIYELAEYTDLRLVDKTKYVCAEALGLYEQKLISNERIYELCIAAYGGDVELLMPAVSYIPDDIIRHFHQSDVVPVSYSPMRSIITCVALPEIGRSYLPISGYNVEVIDTTIYYYFEQYVKHYGIHPDLKEIPAKHLLDAIVNEGISLQAADITISSLSHMARVYYNVRKRKVYSQRILSGDDMDAIIAAMTFESPMDESTNHPKYVGVSLNDYYRGRICINHKYRGYEITTRLLPNKAFDSDLDDLNLTKESVAFIRDVMMNRELGLRLIVGSTMSGKNTTSLAILKEYTDEDKYKVVSIEMPVEQELVGIEQIQCNTEDEYEANINSLIRQNPDFVYITEIGDTTANPVMRMTNTGKKVLSTLHANSCADVIGRIQDITGLSLDRIVQTIHSIVYQELVRDEEKDQLFPKVQYVYLNKERKNKLYGLDYGQIIMKIDEWTGGDIW